MLENVHIKNFKCFGPTEFTLELKPLTVLVGPNGSGKSSFLEAIAIFAQTAKNNLTYNTFYGFSFEGDLFVPIERIEGAKIPSERYDSFFFKKNIKEEMAFTVFLRTQDSVDWQDALSITPQRKSFKNQVGYRISYCKATREHTEDVFVGSTSIARHAYRMQDKEGRMHKFILEFPSHLGHIQFRPRAHDRFFVPESFDFETEKQSAGDLDTAQKVSELSKKIVKIIVDEISNVFYISCERNPSSQFTDTGGRPMWVGNHGQYAMQLYALLYGSLENERATHEIQKWTAKLGIPKLVAGLRGENKLGMDYQDLDYGVALDFNQAGYGSRQIFAVIVQLFTSKPGSVIMIEEPEISLHPEAQGELPRLFAESVDNGRQIIVTTHSEVFISALPRAIGEGKLRAEDIAVYHFSKSKDGIFAERREVTEKGYVKDWIPSFAEAEDKRLKEWMDLVRPEFVDEKGKKGKPRRKKPKAIGRR